MKYRSLTHKKVSGFTLVELLVSIAIFTIVTTVSVLNQSSFNGSIVLTNLAYEIGLSIRQAQVYGVTVIRGVQAGTFDSGYGMRFDMSTPSRYYLFEDRAPSPDHFCDSNECGTGNTYTNVLETFFIQKGNRISKICLNNGTRCGEQVVDISFVRPNPDAYIYAAGQFFYNAEICVVSPVSGAQRKIVVESTGQISVSNNVTVCSN